MVLFAQDGNGNGAKTPFGLPKPHTRAEHFCFNIAQWTMTLVAVLLAIGLVALSVRFARWAIMGSW